MLKKIISGGQTGANQAALDVAIKLGISHGGWIPNGRKTAVNHLFFNNVKKFFTRNLKAFISLWLRVVK